MDKTFYYVQVNCTDCFKTDDRLTAVEMLGLLLKENKLLLSGSTVGIRIQQEIGN